MKWHAPSSNATLTATVDVPIFQYTNVDIYICTCLSIQLYPYHYIGYPLMNFVRDMNLLNYASRVSNIVDSLDMETKGIHRYLPSERTCSSSLKPYISTLGVWIAGCAGLTSMSSFFLGPLLFGLGYSDTLLYGILGQLIGSLVAAYCSIMGPPSGLRQICSSRYLFGPHFVKVVALVSIIGGLGWSITNNVLGGEILSRLSSNGSLNNGLPLSVGVVIVAVITLLVAIFGIKWILLFEAFMGICFLVVILLLYILSSDKYTLYKHLQTSPSENHLTKVGNRISFFTLAYSTTNTWGTCTSDYYIVFPENVSKIGIFLFTFVAISIPTLFSTIVGMLIGNAAVGDNLWNSIYNEESLGGLLNVVFSKWGKFGKFLLVVLWFSLITNNILNTYSAALNAQLLDTRIYRYIPRWLIVIVIFAITLVCSLLGKDHFSSILSNFLPMLGYWVSIYFILLLEENTFFRSTHLVKLFKGELYGVPLPFPTASSTSSINDCNDTSDGLENRSLVDGSLEKNTNVASSKDTSDIESQCPPNDTHSGNSIPPLATVPSKPFYNFDAWNNPHILTNGYAAAFAFCCGVAGAIVGMNQVYYAGPIARKVGDDYADLGTFLALAFAGVSYPLARFLELYYLGK